MTAIRDSVLNGFVPYTEPFESLCLYLYLDVKGLLTIGLGNLVGPGVLSRLVWTKGGAPANQADVAASIAAIHACGLDPEDGGGQYERVPGNVVRATRESVLALVFAELQAFAADLEHFFPAWSTFSADAQLAIFSMAWGYGSHFPAKWPKFAAAVNAGNWTIAAKAAHPSPEEMAKQNDSFHKRVASQQVLFANAARVAAQGLDPDVLYYPNAAAPIDVTDGGQDRPLFSNPCA